MITTLSALAPATRAAAESWLATATGTLDADLAAGLRDELQGALLEGLDADATPADVAALAARIGPLADDPVGAPHDRRVGTFAGIPYDWRPPTGARIKANLWDPASDRLFKPRSFGAGWDLNFGALAVKLGLLEPDAEDAPFTRRRTPPSPSRPPCLPRSPRRWACTTRPGVRHSRSAFPAIGASPDIPIAGSPSAARRPRMSCSPRRRQQPPPLPPRAVVTARPAQGYRPLRRPWPRSARS